MVPRFVNMQAMYFVLIVKLESHKVDGCGMLLVNSPK